MTSNSPLKDEYVAALAEEGNGAVETNLPEGRTLLITLIGPIKTWWGRLDSPEYNEYSIWRDAVRVAIIHSGHLVYSPHRAWQGAWDERAQFVNDEAIIQSDVVIVLTPPDTESVGTLAEIAVAESHGKHVVYAPPSDHEALVKLIESLNEIKASLSI